jgi:hypothetical protein
VGGKQNPRHFFGFAPQPNSQKNRFLGLAKVTKKLLNILIVQSS